MSKKKDRLALELSDYADITIEEGSKVTDYLKENYVIKEKKQKKSKRFINKIKELYYKDTVEYYLNNEKKGRFDYIDAAKAIAMIFIFIGHWLNDNLAPFAYSFHLFLFFMVSGFFALHMQKDNIFVVLKKLLFRLTIPLLLWATIAIVLRDLDGRLILKDIYNLFIKTGEVNPNYWFIPGLFATTLYYWILAKIIKKPWVIVVITFLLNICLGGTSFLNLPHFDFFDKIPLGSWINITAFFTYGFWYALGAAVFPLVGKYVDCLNSDSKKKRYPVKLISYGAVACSIVLLLHKSTFGIFSKSKFIFSNFVIARALVIILAVLFFSNALSKSKVLTKIGTHTLIFVGMEFIIHDFLAVIIMQSFNLGIYNFVNSISLIMYNLITIFFVYKLINPIDNYFPILNGKMKKE